MPGQARPWKANDWEDHIQRLLKKRYSHPPGTYQHIPATTHGDCGLEGFAADGTGYQCYAAQEWVESKQLYEKQRNKITRDIGTFIAKECELLKILGTIKVSLWNFVVPYWNNKDLLKHAREKEKEVLALGLQHVGSSFRIAILTEDDFATELQLLANINLYQFDVAAPPVSPESLALWMADRSKLQLVENLSRKAALISSAKSKDKRELFQARMVANYISGSTVLARLQQELPETYGRVIERKISREANLEAQTFATTKVPADFLEFTLNKYQSELLDVSGISPRVAEILAYEAVSDWLLRCPMDF